MFTKNIFNQKDGIADLVGNILEADYKNKMEELKGDQHKIDKNKNNKIDAHDFKILRGEKTMQKEAAATPHYTDDSGNQYHYGASGYVSVKNKSGIDQGQRHLNDMSAVHKKNYEKVHGMAWNQKNEEVELEEGSKHAARPRSASRPGTEPAKKGSLQDRMMAARARIDAKKKDMKEEVEDVAEGSEDDDVSKTAYMYGIKHGREGVGNNMDRAKAEWGDHFKHYNAGFLKGRNEKAKGLKAFKKQGVSEDVEDVAEGSEQVQIDEIKLRNIIPGLGKQIAKSRSQTKRDQARLAGIDARAAGHPEPRFTGDYPKDTPYDDVRRERDRHHKRADRYDRIAQGKSPFGKSQGVAEGSTDDGTAQRQDSIAQAAKKYLAKEDVEQIDELKKSTLKSYTQKANAEVSDIKKKQAEHPRGHISGVDADKKMNRQIGINQATKRIVKKDLTGVAEGKMLDRLARKFVPGSASRQITNKIKDQHATYLIAKDAGEHGDAELNKKDMHQTARNIDRYNKFAREKGVAEESEQIDELKKSTLKSYTQKANAEVSDIKKKQAEHPRGHISGVDADKKMNRQIGINQATKRIVKKDLTGVAEESEQIDERTLTKGETAEKERIVKGMKKSLAGFKSRYGDKAKSVMYATATARAKK